MSEETLNKIIANAASSVEMEGFSVDEQSKVWCKQLIRREISLEEYIYRIKVKAGVA